VRGEYSHFGEDGPQTPARINYVAA
jgi:hypothetical protein